MLVRDEISEIYFSKKIIQHKYQPFIFEKFSHRQAQTLNINRANANDKAHFSKTKNGLLVWFGLIWFSGYFVLNNSFKIYIFKNIENI